MAEDTLGFVRDFYGWLLGVAGLWFAWVTATLIRHGGAIVQLRNLITQTPKRLEELGKKIMDGFDNLRREAEDRAETTRDKIEDLRKEVKKDTDRLADKIDEERRDRDRDLRNNRH